MVDYICKVEPWSSSGEGVNWLRVRLNRPDVATDTGSDHTMGVPHASIDQLIDDLVRYKLAKGI